MKISLHYYSGAGNTEFLAKKITKSFQNNSHSVDLKRITEDNFDILGIGFPIYFREAPGLIKDEIGIPTNANTNPIQAALYSASTFTVGAALPLLVAWVISKSFLIPAVAISSLAFLALLGGLAARTGGASIIVGALRVSFWGALAMTMTALVGHIFGVSV